MINRNSDIICAGLYTYQIEYIFPGYVFVMVLYSLVGYIVDDKLFLGYCFTYTMLIASH